MKSHLHTILLAAVLAMAGLAVLLLPSPAEASVSDSVRAEWSAVQPIVFEQGLRFDDAAPADLTAGAVYDLERSPLAVPLSIAHMRSDLSTESHRQWSGPMPPCRLVISDFATRSPLFGFPLLE